MNHKDKHVYKDKYTILVKANRTVLIVQLQHAKSKSNPKNVWGDGEPKKFRPRFYDVTNAWISNPEKRGKGFGKEIYKAFIDKAIEYSKSYGGVFIGAHHCTLGSGTSDAAKRVWKSLARDYTSSGDVIFIGTAQ